MTVSVSFDITAFDIGSHVGLSRWHEARSLYLHLSIILQVLESLLALLTLYCGVELELVLGLLP